MSGQDHFRQSTDIQNAIKMTSLQEQQWSWQNGVKRFTSFQNFKSMQTSWTCQVNKSWQAKYYKFSHLLSSMGTFVSLLSINKHLLHAHDWHELWGHLFKTTSKHQKAKTFFFLFFFKYEWEFMTHNEMVFYGHSEVGQNFWKSMLSSQQGYY